MTELQLTGTRITDRGLKELSVLTNLAELSLWDTGITDAGVEEIKMSLPNLKIVR